MKHHTGKGRKLNEEEVMPLCHDQNTLPKGILKFLLFAQYRLNKGG
jgi:hypothetical protein